MLSHLTLDPKLENVSLNQSLVFLLLDVLVTAPPRTPCIRATDFEMLKMYSTDRVLGDATGMTSQLIPILINVT